MRDEKNLILRRAMKEDCRFLFELRNEDEVRKNSFQTDMISYEQHQAWFQRKMRDADTRIYILLLEEVRAGQTRIDIVNRQAEISYALCREARGYGYGKWMLTEIERMLTEESLCAELVAEVKQENIASRRIFQALGYAEETAEFGYCYRKKIG